MRPFISLISQENWVLWPSRSISRRLYPIELKNRAILRICWIACSNLLVSTSMHLVYHNTPGIRQELSGLSYLNFLDSPHIKWTCPKSLAKYCGKPEQFSAVQSPIPGGRWRGSCFNFTDSGSISFYPKCFRQFSQYWLRSPREENILTWPKGVYGTDRD